MGSCSHKRWSYWYCGCCWSAIYHNQARYTASIAWFPWQCKTVGWTVESRSDSEWCCHEVGCLVTRKKILCDYYV